MPKMKSDLLNILFASLYLILQITSVAVLVNFDVNNAKRYNTFILTPHHQKQEQQHAGLKLYSITKRANHQKQNSVNFVFLATPEQLVSLARQNGEISKKFF